MRLGLASLIVVFVVLAPSCGGNRTAPHVKGGSTGTTTTPPSPKSSHAAGSSSWLGGQGDFRIEVASAPADPIVGLTVAFTVKETRRHQLGSITIDFGDGIAEAQTDSLICGVSEVTGTQVSTRTLYHAYSAAGSYQVHVGATVEPCTASKMVSTGGTLVVRPR